MDKKQNHREAFCQMMYRCEGCGFLEIIVNIRDEVTPFMVGCAHCDKGMMQHASWGSDNRLPECPLLPGQRFFRDVTWEECLSHAEKVVGEAKRDGRDLKAGDLAKSYFGDGHTPHCDTYHPEAPDGD